jgi:type 1 glutamine amidotransferase
MRKLLTLALLAISMTAFVAKPASADDAKKIRVLIFDGQNNHDWRSTTPWLKKVLEDSGRFTVAVCSNLKPGDKPGKIAETVAFPPELSNYDVVVSNYNGAELPKDCQTGFEEWLKSGKGNMVIVHAANNSFSGWKEYNQMIGLGWRGNSFGERLIVDETGKEQRIEKGKGPGSGHGAKHAFKIIVRDGEHPITKGMPKEWMHAPDELYHGLRGPIGDIHLLATAYSDKGKGGTGDHEPMIWTLMYGQGRVFHTPMGHDLDGMHCTGFVTTLLRGTEWAATGKVTLPIPENFPKADKVTSLPK